MATSNAKPAPGGSAKAAVKRPGKAQSAGQKYKVEHVVTPLKSGGQPKKR